jgi:calcium-dependent protein kinase
MKKLYAVKSIPKDKIVRELKLLRRELEMLRVVDHPNIIKFYETFEDERYVHIVMEECSGGDLFDHLIVNGQYTEREAAALLEKIIAAINHLHTLHICHRDIKPENFLFATLDKGSDIKIIDFGLATKFGEDQMHTVVGTPYYVAPEVLRGSYGEECDVWSLGVLLFVILGGYPPFFGDSQHEIFRKITHGVYDYDREEWNDVSKEARALIDSMLVVNPQRRATLDQVLKHSWFSLNHDPSNRPQVPLRILDKLKNYRAPRRLKQEALKVVVKFLTNEQIDELRVFAT